MRGINSRSGGGGSFSGKYPMGNRLRRQMGLQGAPNGRPKGVRDGQGYQTANAPIGMTRDVVKNPMFAGVMRGGVQGLFGGPQGPTGTPLGKEQLAGMRPPMGAPGQVPTFGGQRPLPPWFQGGMGGGGGLDPNNLRDPRRRMGYSPYGMGGIYGGYGRPQMY